MFYNQILSPIISSITSFSEYNAFCIKEKMYSYRQLGKCISKIRNAIEISKVHNTKVGLIINDDLETYASILALWLEGYCYVPLHPNWPIERCMDICEQISVDLILDSSVKSRYSKCSVINTSELLECQENLNPVQHISDDELAYILFTSGSTGKPKGVQITRKNIAAFMNSFWKTGIAINENDRCLQCFDLSFDVSVQGYLVPLSRGACAYTVPSGQIKYIYVCSLINRHKLTFGAMAPSMLRYLKPYFDEIDASSLRTCILTAEACSVNLMEDWCKSAKNTEIYDFYGPTECTIYCTYYKFNKDAYNKSQNGIVSIGKPMADCIGLIFDENGEELPTGEKGELCIAGDQVTPGYWNDEEKNESSFFYKEVNGINMRFYHTGDLCYVDTDGDIMYSGRLDHQAKIQGFRVEMGEIEYHACNYLKGINVVCIAYENKDALTEIAMFIEAEKQNQSDLLSYLREKMPSYMIPAQIIYKKEFPINANGKIDKIVLKQLIK